MQAVETLYGEGNEVAARALVSSLVRRVFENPPPAPSGMVRRALARGVVRLMKRTTRREEQTTPDGRRRQIYRNRILERSGHPYAVTLLEAERDENAHFVEGGDPMNAVYMMLVPEVAANAGLWDRIMLDSVQARDVQWRFVWESRLVHELATKRLRRGEPVRLKVLAAGTGLCPIIVVERLLAEGHDPQLISVTISDRERSNIAKTLRLIHKLPASSAHLALHDGATAGIFPRIEDLLEPSAKDAREEPHDVVTLVGLLEYFPGFTCGVTEEFFGEPAPQESPSAADVVARVAPMTAVGGALLVNTFRFAPAVRIMEIFGKRFRYRGRREMAELLATGGFVPSDRCVSANVFDLEVFTKGATQA